MHLLVGFTSDLGITGVTTHLGAIPTLQMKEHCDVFYIIVHRSRLIKATTVI